MLWRCSLKAHFVKNFTSILVVLGGLEELPGRAYGRSWLIVNVFSKGTVGFWSLLHFDPGQLLEWLSLITIAHLDVLPQ